MHEIIEIKTELSDKSPLKNVNSSKKSVASFLKITKKINEIFKFGRRDPIKKNIT
jgi:hypothetical protein